MELLRRDKNESAYIVDDRWIAVVGVSVKPGFWKHSYGSWIIAERTPLALPARTAHCTACGNRGYQFTDAGVDYPCACGLDHF